MNCAPSAIDRIATFAALRDGACASLAVPAERCFPRHTANRQAQFIFLASLLILFGAADESRGGGADHPACQHAVMPRGLDEAQTTIKASRVSAVGPLALPMHATLNDEFLETLNSTVWTAAVRPANAGESQAYAEDAVSILPGGGLRLSATRRPLAGKSFTSGAISSVLSFAQRYGHFEMKAKLPKGLGVWPAFWLLPLDQSWPPEIDIFEYIGRQPTSIYQSLGWREVAGSPDVKVEGGSRQGVRNITVDGGPKLGAVDFSLGYHVYAVDWRPDLIVFSVDGIETWRTTEHVPDKEMYIIANLALGGRWAGIPPDTLIFPINMDIEYIRAFQYDDLPTRQRRFLEFGATDIAPKKTAKDNVVTFRGALIGGAAGAADVVVHVYVQNYQRDVDWLDLPVRVGKVEPNTTYSLCLDIPTGSLVPGLYGIKLLANSRQGRLFLAVANQFEIHD